MRRTTIKDLTGRRFGRLTVVRQCGRTKSQAVIWLCKHDNGTTREVRTDVLQRGDNTGERERHGMRDAVEYRCWRLMRSRCNCPTGSAYKHYGGRGISVCAEWDESFTAFFNDMGVKPSRAHSIERLDVNGNYCPQNCVWADPMAQANNTRRTRRFVYKGKKETIRSISAESGIPYALLASRFRHGWGLDKALAKKKRERRMVTFRGESKPLNEWCEQLGMKWNTVYCRMARYGWSAERALTTHV